MITTTGNRRLKSKIAHAAHAQYTFLDLLNNLNNKLTQLFFKTYGICSTHLFRLHHITTLTHRYYWFWRFKQTTNSAPRHGRNCIRFAKSPAGIGGYMKLHTIRYGDFSGIAHLVATRSKPSLFCQRHYAKEQ